MQGFGAPDEGIVSPRSCFTCHWFGYLQAESRLGYCVNPTLHAAQPSPATGIDRLGINDAIEDGRL